MATASNSMVVEPVRTTKSGIDLESFDDLKLFKEVPVPAEPKSVQEALAALGNDHAKLLKIIHSGLVQEAVTAARKSDQGWFKIDDNGKDTTETFSGSLVSSEILNPVVLNLSRINPVEVLRAGKKVVITWDEATSREEKRAVKDATLDMIRSTPRIVDGLKQKMASSTAKDGE